MVGIKIPDVGAAVDRVKMVRWLVEEGEVVQRGQEIAEIETDKSVVSLESAAGGVLLKKYVFEGGEAGTGDIIAYVGEAGESAPESAKVEEEVAEARPLGAAVAPREIAKARITPMLRNFARQKGVDLESVVGTGVDGTITRQDIIEAAERLGNDR